ncbi:MAG: ubiquinone/menaquinone biosynthesis methyltransferase [Gammaproteobacteria bacterium]|nr:ubiquinone/menaquinone biosynthesis methyltransferase [Gammaproteobacteria bacterium]
MSSPRRIEHSTRFGRETVTPHERDRRMRRIFHHLAPHYDRLCDVMTLGLHRRWRRTYLGRISLEKNQSLLDIAGGCGETGSAFAGPGRYVVVLDSSLPMLKIGQTRRATGIDWVAGLSCALPFPDASMDVVTVSFGLRNVTCVGATLAEVLRVLKPGGQFHCLEVSNPSGVVRPLHHAFSRYVAPWLGMRITREPEAYDYFVESVLGFPGPREIRDLLVRVGFSGVRYKRLSLGIACIHSATRP